MDSSTRAWFFGLVFSLALAFSLDLRVWASAVIAGSQTLYWLALAVKRDKL